MSTNPNNDLLPRHLWPTALEVRKLLNQHGRSGKFGVDVVFFTMMGGIMKTLGSCIVALTALMLSGTHPAYASVIRASDVVKAEPRSKSSGAIKPTEISTVLPSEYIRAFMCVFDGDPIALANRYHGTQDGRAARARDLKLLRALGFTREGRDGELDSSGGRVPGPSGTRIFGLPVRSLELNGMIGDANALYVTTFDQGVTVAQVVEAANLKMDRSLFARYKMRHYSRRVGSSPYVNAFLDDRGGSTVSFTCQVQSTPD